MSKVLSLTASEVGALKNLLEAPEVEIEAPELSDLRSIYNKLHKESKPKEITGSGGITIKAPNVNETE